MKIFRKLRSLLRKEKLDAEMTDEMHAHLDALAAENEQRGLSPAEARFAAQRQFGGVEQIKERARDARGWRWLEEFFQDLRYGVRMLRKSPGFTGVAVLTLALGIGVNTAIFTLLNHFVFQPPRVSQPETVVAIFAKDRRSPSSARSATPFVDYAFLREHNAVFNGLAAALLMPVTLGPAHAADANGAGSPPEEGQVFAQIVTGNYFDVLGGRAALGRTFRPDEDQVPGARPVAVLSHEFWQHRYAGDRSALGQEIVVNGIAFTIVGVTAAEFGGNRQSEPALWVPMMMAAQVRPGSSFTERTGTYVDIVGRLKPGVNLAAAQAQLDVVATQNLAQRPDSVVLGVRVTPLAKVTEEAAVWALIVTLVTLLLLVVAANVANLSLARGVARHREIGIRLTLGAGRGRILRQLLVESVLLGLLGGAAGLLLAQFTTQALATLIDSQFARFSIIDWQPATTVEPDWRVFLFALVVAVGAGVAVGLAPALQATKLDLVSALKDEGSVFGQRLSRSRLRNLLVVIQVALCAVLLVGAGLLGRALQRAQSIDPGFAVRRMLVVREDLRAHGYGPMQRGEFYRSFAERVRQLPGVKAVAFATSVPLQGGTETGPAAASPTERGRQVSFNFVSADFFPALGTPIIAGRNFREDEARQSAPVAIVNEALAHLLWPNDDPVGKPLHNFFRVPATVVGVVRNTRDGRLWAAAEPAMYFLDRPGVKDALGSSDRNLAILVRTEAEPLMLAADVRDTLRALDGNLWPVVRTLESNLDLQLAPSRVGAWLSAALGLLALAVTTVGLYGVVAYATAQRTREIGVRLALGARPGDVIRLVLGQGWRLVFAGLVCGGGGAAVLAMVLAKFLYGLPPFDPVAFGGVGLFLTAVALPACWLPARRATRVDPMVALRCE